MLIPKASITQIAKNPTAYVLALMVVIAGYFVNKYTGANDKTVANSERRIDDCEKEKRELLNVVLERNKEYHDMRRYTDSILRENIGKK